MPMQSIPVFSGKSLVRARNALLSTRASEKKTHNLECMEQDHMESTANLLAGSHTKISIQGMNFFYGIDIV